MFGTEIESYNNEKKKNAYVIEINTFDVPEKFQIWKLRNYEKK